MRVSEFLGLLAGTLGGVVASFLVMRFRTGSARVGAEAILGQARREAETIGRQAEITAKEELLRRREEFDTELDELRREVREQERRVEKRADLLDQKLDLINRKEHDFESLQRQVADQQEDLRRREAEVRKVLSDQLDALRRIANLSPEDARDLLLKRVEDELRAEVGSLILKHQAALRESAQQLRPRDPHHDDPAVRRGAHRRDDRQHRGHPQRRDEGPDHRPRGAEYPRLREGHRRRRDHRRHARASSSSPASTASAARSPRSRSSA